MTNQTQIEQHIGLAEPDATMQETSGQSVTGKHLFADGGDGKEKEATTRDPHAGASSDAPPSSGIPSARAQHGVPGKTEDQDETPMAGRVLEARQDSPP